MLVTLLVLFVFRVNCVIDTDQNHVDQVSGYYYVYLPVPMDFNKIKYDDREYDRLPNGMCQHITSSGGTWKVPCGYNPENKTASVKVQNTKDTAWVGFEMFSSSEQKGYQTVFFTQNGTWSRINQNGCILPQYSSPSVIYAVDQTAVTIKCARKKTCNKKDNTLIMSIEGTKKCEKDVNGNGVDPVVPCRRDAATSADVDVYSLDILKPWISTNGGKTYVYCGTATSQISFVVQWNYDRIDQASGPYNASIPVPMDFQRIKYDNREYDRLPNGMCQHITSSGATWKVKCGYDAETKTAFVAIQNAGRTAWVGFEMFSSSEQKGYQTVYLTQNGTWAVVKRDGCILPQYSSPSVIDAADQTAVTIKCARKKTCNQKDNTLIMSIEGTKKCEKDGSGKGVDTVVPCRRYAAASADVDVYSLDVLKPVIPTNGGKTYVYCGTSTSQISFVVDWKFPLDFHRIYQATGPYTASIPVPMDFQKIKYDNREYDRLPNGRCRYIPPGGGTPWEVKCGYDAETKTAFVRVLTTRETAWVGFEMYSSSAQKGYQTVYFTQNATWAAVKRNGCILPQYSSPSVINAAYMYSVNVLCARKKTCNNNDNTLIMSIEGTKKCEIDGSGNGVNPVVRCARTESTRTDVDFYSIDVLRPKILPNGGKTYVYCGTSTSQLSFVVDWTYKNRQ